MSVWVFIYLIFGLVCALYAASGNKARLNEAITTLVLVAAWPLVLLASLFGMAFMRDGK